MTAQTKDIDRPRVERPGMYTLNIKAGEVYFVGAMAQVDNNRRALEATATTGVVTLGVIQTGLDATNMANDEATIEVVSEVRWFANSGGGEAISADEIGEQCFVADSATVQKTSGGDTTVKAGRIFDVDATKGVLVGVGPLFF